MAKSRAPFGSSVNPACAAPRGAYTYPAPCSLPRPFRSNPLQGSAALRRLTAPLSALPSPFMKRMFFSGLPRPEFYKKPKGAKFQ